MRNCGPLLVALALAAPVPAAPREQGGERRLRSSASTSARVWETADNTDHRISQQDDIDLQEDFDFNGPVIHVGSKRGHKVEGFGGAFTEATAVVFQKLPKDQQAKVLEMYFGESGIGYTLGRVHINSCDFSTENYDFDGVDGDMDLKHFDDNVTRDTEALIPLILKAKQLVAKQNGAGLRLLASPWSPPAWMKNNGGMDGSSEVCLKDGLQGTWAKYISRWITAYKRHGVPIWAMTVQNEPEFAAPWDACTWSAEQEMSFLASELGPEMEARHPEVYIFGYDHNKDHLELWADTIYGDAKASQYASGIAFHWYSGDGFDAVRNVHEKYPNAMLLPSEATFEKPRTGDGKWSLGEGYAHDILHDLNSGSCGWIDWNLLLNQDGGPNHVNNLCDAAMLADENSGELWIHPQYYYMGHFSKFILPKSVHLESKVEGSQSYTGDGRGYGTCTGDDGLQATAFQRPDGLVAVVVLNCGDGSMDFKMLFEGKKALQANIPSHGIQTYLVSPGGSFTVTTKPPPALSFTGWTTRTGTTTTTTGRGQASARSSGFELRAPNTGCTNWDQIGMGKSSTVGSAEECGELCQSRTGCVGFGYQARDSSACSGGGINKGACMLWSESCAGTANTCFDDYRMRDSAADDDDGSNIFRKYDAVRSPQHTLGGGWLLLIATLLASAGLTLAAAGLTALARWRSPRAGHARGTGSYTPLWEASSPFAPRQVRGATFARQQDLALQ